MRLVALVLCTATVLLVLNAVTPAANAAGPRLDAGERSIVRTINGARAQHGLERLLVARRLSSAADAHTRHMLRADSFAHGAFVERVRSYVEFRSIGETLAMMTHCSARQAVRMWLRSPGHRAVLLSRAFRRVGVGRRIGRIGSARACLVTADFASLR